MHIESEGPGTIIDYLESMNAHTHIAMLYRGDQLPNDVHEFDAIIVMGGPMNVYQDEQYHFLREETVFLRQAVENNIPILGICLGAQLIAKSCFARVKSAQIKEIGWSKVTLTKEGRCDLLFQGLPETLSVLQWHEDTFDLPYNGILLATSKECPNQAFRYKNAYGLQFHVEVTSDMLSEWFSESREHDQIMNQFQKIKKDYTRQAKKIYSNFVALIRTHTYI